MSRFPSVVQSFSCVRLCDTMDCSTPGFPVLHCLLELAQVHVHWVGDAIQPFLLCPSFNRFPSVADGVHLINQSRCVLELLSHFLSAPSFIGSPPDSLHQSPPWGWFFAPNSCFPLWGWTLEVPGLRRYLFIFLIFITYLLGCSRSWPWYVGSSFLIRNPTQAPCIGSTRS